jgi:hypothetical protein
MIDVFCVVLGPVLGVGCWALKVLKMKASSLVGWLELV